MRPVLIATSRVGLGLLLWMAAADLAAAAQPAAELPDATLVPLVADFVKSCSKDFAGDTAMGGFYCPCAAAIVVDRLTVDELTKDAELTLDGMEKAHPGIARLLRVCGVAAKRSTK